MSDLTRYLVTWADANSAAHFNRVIIEEGVTTLDDVPRILAVAHGIPESSVQVDKITAADSKYRRQFKPVPRAEGDAPDNIPWV